MWSALVTERTPQRLVRAILKNQAEDHVLSNDDVGCDFNNCRESALDLCGDLAIIGDKNITTEDSVAEDNASAIGNKKSPRTDSASYSQNNTMLRAMMILGVISTILMV